MVFVGKYAVFISCTMRFLTRSGTPGSGAMAASVPSAR